MSDKTGEIFHSELRFGHVAVQKGFITQDQLLEALKVQVEEDLAGEPHRLLGRILCEQGAMRWGQVGKVLLILGKTEDVFQ
jgi:hypothetical protein